MCVFQDVNKHFLFEKKSPLTVWARETRIFLGGPICGKNHNLLYISIVETSTADKTMDMA